MEDCFHIKSHVQEGQVAACRSQEVQDGSCALDVGVVHDTAHVLGLPADDI